MELGQTLPIWSIIPFAGMLLSIAVFPLVRAEWWEKHQLLVSLAWALLFLVPFALAYGAEVTAEQLAEVVIGDYIPFIVLLLGLYVVAGGIHVGGTIAGTTRNNVIMLFIGTMLAILVRYSDNTLFKNTFVWALMIVLLRELAVTSLRMIASQKAGAVIAAGKLGKIKTVTQMVCMLTCLLEGILPAVTPLDTHMALSYLTTAVMTVMTLWSGLDYFRAYWKYLDPQK